MVTNLLLPVTQLIIEGATAIAIFVRCFSDKNGMEQELKRKLYVEFPRSVLATISVINVVSNLHHNHHSVTCSNSIQILQVLLTLMIAYGSAAMGQLFFFHVVLIRKVLVNSQFLVCY